MFVATLILNFFDYLYNFWLENSSGPLKKTKTWIKKIEYLKGSEKKYQEKKIFIKKS